MTRQQWEWVFLDAADDVLPEPVSPVFTTRFDAEAWLGEHWRRLVGEGIAAARLTQQGGPVSPPVVLRSP